MMNRHLLSLSGALWAVLILVALPVMPLHAQDEDTDDSAADAASTDDEDPSGDGEEAGADDAPAGDAPAHDVVTLGAGPRADLQFTGFQKGKLEFGGGFGAVKVAPDDVASIRLKDDAERTMYLKDAKRADAREVRVLSRDGTLYYYRADESADAARAIDFAEIYRISGDPIPYDKWSGTIAATFSIGRGNTEDVSAGIVAELKRETNHDTLTFHYEFGYTETEVGNVISVSRRFHEGFIEYRYFLSDAWNLFAKNTLRNDSIAGLEYRNTTDIGGSWWTLKEDDLHLRFDLSVNHTFERTIGSQATNYMGGTAAADFKTKLGDPLVFLLFAKITEDFDDTDNWVGQIKATLNNDLGEGFSLSLVAQLDYDNVPAAGFKNTDFRLTAILGWTFET